tara:strand:+ start:140 stop:1462 length:1323 start_codon:yes stop_codon:yes gene_type:complete
MGSIRKVFKKATKIIKKPISKITKGIARGIAKVGKSVMKGVAKLNKKLGPLGTIALSIAMPYALSGLSSIVGQGAVGALGPQIPSGLMGSQNVFLRSIGNVGNAIRTGYNVATGAIKTGMKTITRSITEGFSKMSGGKGNGLWSKISNGAKNLFNKARATVKKYSPKFRTGTEGTVTYQGALPGGGTAPMTIDASQAAKYLESGLIDASQITKQTLGSAEGYFTKAGSSQADKLITETINASFDDTIGRNLSNNALTHMDNLATISDGTFANKYDMWDSMSKNKGLIESATADGSIAYDFDFAKSGDYTLGSARDRVAGNYNFNGNSTLDNTVIKQSKNKNALVDKVKKKSTSYITKKGTDYLKNLLSPSDLPQQSYEGLMTPGAEFASTQGGALTSSTDLTGAMGTKYFSGVFGNEAWNKLKNYHRHMNYVGSAEQGST